jgi:hypothetical protein
MNIHLAQELAKIPQVKELMEYLQSEAVKLNRLDDLNVSSADITVEVLARRRAFDAIGKMLDPLINAGSYAIIESDEKEYDIVERSKEKKKE